MTASDDNLPAHVAIIMDGNNRWAKSRRLPSLAGHKAGVETVRTILNRCGDRGINVLTLFAFSSENWKRPRREVDALMRLFQNYLRGEAVSLRDNGVTLRVIGNRERFSDRLLAAIEEAERITQGAGERTLVIAADYGGQWDIAQAARCLARAVAAGELPPEAVTEDRLAQALSLSDLPRPDLCIRTGGEHRISNFLLWQFAYTELYFTDVFWPDFDQAAFDAALADYARRQRRFGRTGDQVEADRSC